MATVLSVVEVIISVILIFLVLLHSGKDAGLSGAFGIGGGGSAFGGRLAGGAEPDPVDHLLRDPLGAERDRHPQALAATDAAARRHARSSSALRRRSPAAAVPEADTARGQHRACRPPAGAAPSPTRCRASQRRSIRSPRRPRPADRHAAGLRAADRAAHRALRARPRRRPASPWRRGRRRDRTTWTVTLRPNVRFQDGTPFNAAAVLANSRRWQTRPCGPERSFRTCSRSTRPRPDEVRFLLDQPVPDLVAAAELSAARDRLAAGPRSAERAERRASSPDAAGSGTGAFEPGPSGPGRQTLSRFAGWWGSPIGPRARARRRDLRARPAAEPAASPAAGRARSRSPTRWGRSACAPPDPIRCSTPSADPLSGIGLEGSVRGIDSAQAIPILSSVWLTRLTG